MVTIFNNNGRTVDMQNDCTKQITRVGLTPAFSGGINQLSEELRDIAQRQGLSLTDSAALDAFFKGHQLESAKKRIRQDEIACELKLQQEAVIIQRFEICFASISFATGVECKMLSLTELSSNIEGIVRALQQIELRYKLEPSTGRARTILLLRNQLDDLRIEQDRLVKGGPGVDIEESAQKVHALSGTPADTSVTVLDNVIDLSGEDVKPTLEIVEGLNSELGVSDNIPIKGFNNMSTKTFRETGGSFETIQLADGTLINPTSEQARAGVAVDLSTINKQKDLETIGEIGFPPFFSSLPLIAAGVGVAAALFFITKGFKKK